MKLCRVGAAGQERPACVDQAGRLRDLSGICHDIEGSVLSGRELNRLMSVPLDQLPVLPRGLRYGPPIAGISKIVCVGLNYRDHALEAALEIPTEPVVFLKSTTSIAGPDDTIMMPFGGEKLDWEIELGVVIGQTARNVGMDVAANFVAGYCIVNDVSERAFQMQSSQWGKGKGCDTFGPMGPWLVTADEVPDPQSLKLHLSVNGTTMQNSSTAEMIFPVHELVSYVSRYMTLLPGDVIATGTPAGVGLGAKPAPIWLRPDDSVELKISGLGTQRQKVAIYSPSPCQLSPRGTQ